MVWQVASAQPGPAVEGDMGRQGRVLARCIRGAVIWRHGHKVWDRARDAVGYSPSELVVLFLDGEEMRICSGGRLAPSLIRRHAAEVATLLGLPEAELVEHLIVGVAARTTAIYVEEVGGDEPEA